MRLSDPDASIPSHIAAGVLGSTWSAVWATRSKQRREEELLAGRDDPDLVDRVECFTRDDGLGPLLGMIEEAVRRGALSARGARLVVLHWVHGFTNAELAEMDGLRPSTIRKHRRAAELQLADFAA
jgi:DNA-directed RNA polymerase specialized sigma24 family protein